MLDKESIIQVPGGYVIRRQRSNEESKKIWWPFLQGLGWNRSYHDFETYFDSSDPPGLLVVCPKDTNEPVGHVGAVVNSNSTGWVSVFIVDGEHRGKALGAALFRECINDFKACGTQFVGLDGVEEQVKTYERRGFVNAGSLSLMVRPLVAKEPLPTVVTGAKVVDVRKVPYHLLVQHELALTGFERKNLWTDEHMFNRPDVFGFAAVSSDKPQSLSDLHAWTVVRRCSNGYRIGPVLASDAASAQAVLAAATNACTPSSIAQNQIPNEPMSDWPEEKIVDEAHLIAEVWLSNPKAKEVFEGMGWKNSGWTFYRMWLDGKKPEAWNEGGAADRHLFAIFDAAVG